MKKTPPRAAILAASALLAAIASTSQAQVTLSQVTNGLVSWYPLDNVVTNGSLITTYDYVGGRDMLMVNMSSTNVIASTHPSQNSASVSNCFNFGQQNGGQGTTIMYYDSKGQNKFPLDGPGTNGDFLPFCNQINATMNFWIKSTADTNVAVYNDKRFFGECDDGSAAGTSPIWLFGTSSVSGAGGGLMADARAHFLFRQNSGSGSIESYGPGPLTLADTTKQSPDFAGLWQQGDDYTWTNLLDGSWHMLTFSIDTNRVVDIYIDGVRDLGPSTNNLATPRWTDQYGNANWGPTFPLTNWYYTTNIYPAAGVSNPPPNGYVTWVWNGNFLKGVTAFGGFRRQGGNTGGFPMLYDDIGFWNRRLDTNEIAFIYTNGIYGIPLNRPLAITTFKADFPEVGKGDAVTLSWNVQGALTLGNSGGIVISGVGDVSSKGLAGTTNVTITGDKTFTLTIHNGIAPDQTATISVKSFAGVSSQWHLIERFEQYADTDDSALGGLTTNNWISAGGDFSGPFDKWNVVSITNNGAVNKVLGPQTGYLPNAGNINGSTSRGALSFARIGSLTMSPGQNNTLFFRVSLQEAPPVGGYLTDLDFGVGLSDYNFLGPSAGLGQYGGTGGGLGPYFSILRQTGGQNPPFVGGPFSFYAPDTADPAAGNTAGSVTSTLQTNVDYLVWMDITDNNTHSSSGNTINQATYSVWIMQEGDASRTELVTNFHGNRNYVGFNPVNDNPTPFLDKVFLNIGSEDYTSSTNAAGAYFNTNTIAVDDIYISKSGFNSSIPRLFDVTSVVRGAGSVTIKWDSLGSIFGTNTYSVLRKLNLNDPAPWTVLTNGMPSGGDTSTFVDTTIGSANQAFYRISWP